MAGHLDVDCVKYACICGLLKPITQLYFCRYCSELRCGFCLCHEVDSHYCGKCCENLPSSEARLKKNRCGNCFICPVCDTELATRVAPKQSSANPEDVKATPKKMYYLSCHFCRWSSRDIGIPDQSAASGSWPSREHAFGLRLQEIIDMYKAVIVKERQEKDLFKKKQRGKYISFTDKTGITAAAIRKRIGLTDELKFTHKNAPKKVAPSKAEEEIDDFPEHLLKEPVSLLEVTTIEQRLLQPETQPEKIDKLFPIHKQLSIKQSLRCRCCEHNVSKPEHNPSSVKFKIQLFAYYHIPDIKIVTVEPLRAGKPCELILKFTNPTPHQTVVSFLPFVCEENTEVPTEEKVESQVENPPEKKSTTDLSLTSLASQTSSLISMTLRHSSITLKPRALKHSVNADVTLPESTFILPPRDETAEFDDFSDTQNYNDDPKLVMWRKSNKAIIKLSVTPTKDIDVGSTIFAGFTMSHVYTNTITSAVDNKHPQILDHKVRVVLELGTSVGSE